MSTSTAHVDVLTAEVRALMVGSRQVTLSVYRQLDRVLPADIEPFGRVRDRDTHPPDVAVVGRHIGTGALVASSAMPIPGEDIPMIVEWRPWRLALRSASPSDELVDYDGRQVLLAVNVWDRPDRPTIRWLAEQFDNGRAAARWPTLPLIVLAGLR